MGGGVVLLVKTLMRGGIAALPIARDAQPFWVGFGGGDEVLANGFCRSRFASHPAVEVAFWQCQAFEFCQQWVADFGCGGVAEHPVQLHIGAAGQGLHFFFVGHFNDGQRAASRGQLLQATGDGGQGSVVAREQVPVKIGGNDE